MMVWEGVPAGSKNILLAYDEYILMEEGLEPGIALRQDLESSVCNEAYEDTMTIRTVFYASRAFHDTPFSPGFCVANIHLG